jgi:hypothetical protein
LETDWIEAVELLGAEKVLTDRVREVAKMPGFRPSMNGEVAALLTAFSPPQCREE